MTRAWQIARKEYERLALVHILKGLNLEINIPAYTADEKRDLIAKHPKLIKYKIRKLMSKSLREAWREAKHELANYEKCQRQYARQERLNTAKEINKNAPRRELVAAEKYAVGDRLGKFIITGLGRDFRPNVDMFSRGITPDTERVQYAYFN